MFRKTFAVLTAIFVVLVGAAPGASAAPRAGLRVSATAVQTTGPQQSPVDWSCQAVHPPYSSCGYAFATLTVRGFDAYGGLAETGEADQFGGIDWAASSARFTEVYTCGDSRRPRVLTTRIGGSGIWYGYDSFAGPASRVDSDTARLRAAFQLPSPLHTTACPRETRFQRGWLSEVRVVFTGGGGAPGATWRVPGSHVVAPVPA
ncbi:hypothetical protein [Kineococcus sp. SYSU DK006]|uniref:hypothetical protein n=1 Tax=Kineococcus sp. SYSU DK006 TaxID=3383127 RepID=UPI003D7C90C7